PKKRTAACGNDTSTSRRTRNRSPRKAGHCCSGRQAHAQAPQEKCLFPWRNRSSQLVCVPSPPQWHQGCESVTSLLALDLTALSDRFSVHHSLRRPTVKMGGWLSDVPLHRRHQRHDGQLVDDQDSATSPAPRSQSQCDTTGRMAR